MGCYGIGITRLPAAAIEQNHDERGIIWPDAIAPFTVVICPVGMDRSEAVKTTAESLYADLLAAGVDVILDDRGERPGAMFADWELIGVPHRVTVGDKSLKGRRGRVPAPPRRHSLQSGRGRYPGPCEGAHGRMTRERDLSASASAPTGLTGVSRRACLVSLAAPAAWLGAPAQATQAVSWKSR